MNVINIAFTIIEEGKKAQSVLGNYSVAVLKIGEIMMNWLLDIHKKAEDLEVLTVNDKVYNILGGDLRLLAIVCGMDATNAEHTCVWCKYPKSVHSDMKQDWLLTNSEKGARIID